MKQVVPEYDLLGWYSTGKEVTTLDMKIHQQVMSFVESPIYLLVDLESDKPQTSDIPVTLYESELVVSPKSYSQQKVFSSSHFFYSVELFKTI